MKTIKLAVVGTTKNGKTHLLWDIFKILQEDYNISVNSFDGYANASEFQNLIQSQKNIDKTLKNDRHYKIQCKNFILEFMDIAGEAFQDTHNITIKYRTIINMLKKTNHFNNKKKMAFTEKVNKERISHIYFDLLPEQDTRTNDAGNNQTSEERKPKGNPGKDEDKNPPTPSTPQQIDQNGTKRLGKYVAKHLEFFDTESVINCIQAVVKWAKEQTDLNDYNDKIGTPSNDFWKYFYNYVFCDNCTDLVICDLIVLPKGMQKPKMQKPNSSEKTSSNENTQNGTDDTLLNSLTSCTTGIGNFFKDRDCPRTYIVFRGLDALIKTCKKTKNTTDEQTESTTDEETKNTTDEQTESRTDDNNNELQKLFKNLGKKYQIVDINAKKKLLPFAYFLFHLAFYKMFGSERINENDFENACKKIIQNENSFLKKITEFGLNIGNNEDFQNKLKELLEIDSTKFVVNETNEDPLTKVFTDRIQVCKEHLPNVASLINEVCYPHVYFSAYPIDIYFNIHKNKKDDPKSFEGINAKTSRYPLGVYNFLTDLIYANTGEGKKDTDMENYLYLSNDIKQKNFITRIRDFITDLWDLITDLRDLIKK
ncbi:MAG: hypothetical protein FWH18_02515 [Marinilabiliaceae bacterium]|nr:hypothetical protein [Marinilabiliaceae bacterium]